MLPSQHRPGSSDRRRYGARLDRLLVEDKMIGREPGRIVITCDACGRLLQGDSDEWIDVWPRASRAGWRARKIGKEWCQFCGELCASKLTDDQIRHRH